jgi:CheY-like chemotaxis protein
MSFSSIEALMIDDNSLCTDLILKAFELKNLAGKIFIVNNGKDAIDYLSDKSEGASRNLDEKLKVIILELKLAGQNGLEILRTIKSDENLKSIPVVVLSSSRDDKDISDSYKLGANSYIVKNEDDKEFLKTVSEIAVYWLLINEPPL